MNSQNINYIDQMDELEQLRAQVAEFKSRLDEQEIVNDRLLRNVVKGKVKSLRKFSVSFYILGILGYLIIVAACLAAHVSVLPLVALGLMLVGEGVFTFWNLHKISGVSEMSVLEGQTAMASYIKREKWLNILEVPVLIAVIVWAYYSSEGISLTFLDVKGVIEGGFVGFIGGVAYVAYIFRKQFRMIRDIKKSINTLRDETK